MPGFYHNPCKAADRWAGWRGLAFHASIVNRGQVQPTKGTAGGREGGSVPDRTKERVLLTVAELTGVWARVHGFLLLALRQPVSRSPGRPTVEAFVDELGRKLVEVGFFSREELTTLEDLEARAGGWGSSKRPKRGAWKRGAD